jgi:Cysteine-rich CPCC
MQQDQDKSEFLCPVCEQGTFSGPGTYEICDVCKWENDPVQLAKPDLAGGANKLSLKQARRAFLSSQA